MSKIKAIISDADGTLVNTLYLIRHGQYETAVSYLAAQGVPRHHLPSYEAYEAALHAAVGGPTPDTFKRTLQILFKETNPEYLEQIDIQALNAGLDPIQDQIAPLYVHPFYGLHELCTWMGQAKLSLAIFTSGTPHHVVRNFGVSLPALGYTELFKNSQVDAYEKLRAFTERAKAVYGFPGFAFVTCDDVTKAKPDPEGIIKALEMLGARPDEAIVLGDHEVDMAAAASAGVRGVGVTHGFGMATGLEASGAFRVATSLSEVTQLIEDHNSGRQPLF